MTTEYERTWKTIDKTQKDTAIAVGKRLCRCGDCFCCYAAKRAAENEHPMFGGRE